MSALARDIPDQIVNRAVKCVMDGGILLHPTDTVYGIGGDASNDDVSARIRRLKGTDSSKPLLVLTDSWDRVEHWIAHPDKLTRTLMTIGREHSLTILFSATASVPRGLVGSSSEVGIRLCLHPFCAKVIRRSGQPLSSTSANRTGKPVPILFDEVDEEILGGSDLAVDGGPLDGAASTIVRAANGRVEVVREGSLPTSMLSRLIG